MNIDIDKYGLENYDEDNGDEQNVKNLFSLGNLACFADARDDPLMEDIPDEEDEEDNEDFLIRSHLFFRSLATLYLILKHLCK